MHTRDRYPRSFLLCAALAALLMVGVQAAADTEHDNAEEGAASLTVSSSSIKGQAGNKLIILAKGDDSSGRLCLTIPSDDFSLPATTLSEAPVPWNPCGPETPQAVLTDDAVVVLAMVRVPDTRKDLARLDQEVTLSGATEIMLDGSKLSADAE